MIKNLEKIFTASFWTSIFSQRKSFVAKAVRVCIAALRGFSEDECDLKASALTFYSMLSIVPVLAVAFGIAKGFGFEKHLENEITHRFFEQPDIAEKLINFAYVALKSAQGGLIAGIGIIVLFWTVLKLLGNIESSFNAIWKVKKSRSVARKFSDYLAMMIFCPLFFAASSSLSVFIVTQISSYSQTNGLWDAVSPFVSLSFQVFPLIFSWLLFTAIYLVMPNTKVPLNCALTAGIIAGTAFQVVQWAYINFQLGISSYGAIYGSFAALPLFLLWLNFSWLITLAGAEIAYHTENDLAVSLRDFSKPHQNVDERLIGIVLTGYCIEAFTLSRPPPNIHELARKTGIAVVTARQVVHQLRDFGILSEVRWGQTIDERYQPGRDAKSITLKTICDSLDSSQHQYYMATYDEQMQLYKEKLDEFDKQLEIAPVNVSLVDILQTTRQPIKE